jgi:hypothetical protein
MFDNRQYPFDREHHGLERAGESMIVHCHHDELLRSILDSDPIDSRTFLIGAATDAARPRLRRLCAGLSRDEA